MVTKTHTYALLAIPPAAFAVILNALYETGESGRIFLINGSNDHPVNAIDMNGIILTGQIEDNRDLLRAIDEWGDEALNINELSFIAGYKAACDYASCAYDQCDAESSWYAFNLARKIRGVRKK